jgi:hypothetical protein
MIQQMASEMNKSKRQIFRKLAPLIGITEVVSQVTSYSKMFEIGSLHLILGKIRILPADRDTAERQRGLSEVTPSWNGNRPGQVHCCGFMGSVSPPTPTLSHGVMMPPPPDSGRRKERALVC